MTDPKFSLEEINARLTNVERLLIRIQAEMTPKWLRMSAWGALIGAALKELLFK